ncbi:hypothetical protein A5707_19025 [Mycobacterium kyorinense]|uniref:Uncharacterized protein n=1 Tax=Mycobacterium kyorinense TaxID=487514 RepID=A0A1A2ZDM6_9MYCO|nr:hypothetical protein [Mycobacterium kyorinense]OBI47567.1 hypothetical protein A5707_19025 [Mycobacterium kyorinense]
MTREIISSSRNQTDDGRWRSIFADLAFWSLAGAIVAALSGPLGDWWSVPHPALLAGGLSFLVGGVGLLFWLNRMRPIPRRLVRGFGVFNLIFAPVVWVTAWYGWLPLSESGNWALVAAGVIAIVLGGWQLNTSR